MTRNLVRTSLLLIVITSVAWSDSSQWNSEIDTFFRRNTGLSHDQVASIRNGQPVVKAIQSRTPAEVFLFGAVRIQAAPESYVEYVHDFDRLRNLPGYLALGVIHNPPAPADWRGFSFGNDDIQGLKNCKPGDCQIQMPASSIDDLQRSVNWRAPDVNDQINQLLQKAAQERLLIYQHEGNQALGSYNDKHEPIDVAQQFAYLVSYTKVLPNYLPDFYRYLLAYPNAKPANVDDAFYWSRVKFGLKPTLRVVQLVAMRGNPNDQVACAIAEKQLYASHYFETALDLSFCIRGNEDQKQSGFYLIMLLGSEQAGLTGVKGSVVRKAVVGRSVSNLRDSLMTIKSVLKARK